MKASCMCNNEKRKKRFLSYRESWRNDVATLGSGASKHGSEISDIFFQLVHSAARQEVAERSWKNDHDPSSFVSAANIARRDRKKQRCATRNRFARVHVEAAIYIRDVRKKRVELLPKFSRTEQSGGRERERERERGGREGGREGGRRGEKEGERGGVCRRLQGLFPNVYYRYYQFNALLWFLVN